MGGLLLLQVARRGDPLHHAAGPHGPGPDHHEARGGYPGHSVRGARAGTGAGSRHARVEAPAEASAAHAVLRTRACEFNQTTWVARRVLKKGALPSTRTQPFLLLPLFLTS